MRYLLALLTLTATLNLSAQATDLIISEYVEGSSNNKYIELYNGTAASINLADYQLRLYANGAATPTTTAALTGTLTSGSTIVYKNSAATIYGGTATVNTALAFNGDDAIVLYKVSTASFVDIVGNIGCDPGTAWTSGSYTTLDKTLIRNAAVCNGVTTDPVTSCPFPTLATEWTQSNIDIVSDLGTHTMTCVSCTPATAPATLAGGFGSTTFCTSAQLSFTAGDGGNRIVVVSTTNFADSPVNGTAYSANSIFGSGATVGPGNYVVMNGSGNSVTVTGLTNSTTYYVKIFEYNGVTANCDESYLTAGVTAFTFNTQSNCATPQIRSVLVDACSSQEGIDELVIIENGVDPLPVNDITIAFPSGGTYCNSGCGTNTLINNPAYITQLNTQAGCTLFQYADPIPAGAIIVVFTGLTPSYVFDYSSQCPSSSTYYAVFCNNASTAGRFANSGTGTRTLDITFGANSDQVTYDLSSTLGDGTFVDFDNPGNPTYRQELNCIYPLGVNWGSFKATALEKEVLLNWKTLAEKNADYFAIEHTNGSIPFSTIGTVKCTGNTQQTTGYTFMDRQPGTGLNYYRLKQFDFDGKWSYSSIEAVNYYSSELTAGYISSAHQLVFSHPVAEESTITVFSSEGQLLQSVVLEEKRSSIPFIAPSGILLIRVIESNGNCAFLRVFIP